MLKRIFAVEPIHPKADLGLLVLRVGAGVSLFIKHGLEKIDPAFWSAMATTFPDPVHIGHLPSLFIATISDAVCSVLLVFGLFSRLAAAYVFVILATAWSLTHDFIFLGKGLEPKHGELIVMYMTVSLGLALLGPGKFSLDYVLWGNKSVSREAAPARELESHSVGR